MLAHAKDLRKDGHLVHGCCYSVTSTTNKRVPVFSDFYLARKLVESLKKSDKEQATDTIGFVIMPDHFHWLFQLKGSYSLSDTVGRVKGRAALAVNKQRNGIHKIWQPGFHDKCIRKEEDVIRIMRHIAASPVRTGLAKSLKYYPHWDCIYL